MNSTVIIVISGLLTAFFIFASSIKILGWQKMIFETQLEFFKKYGLNRTIMVSTIGLINLHQVSSEAGVAQYRGKFCKSKILELFLSR